MPPDAEALPLIAEAMPLHAEALPPRAEALPPQPLLLYTKKTPRQSLVAEFFHLIDGTNYNYNHLILLSFICKFTTIPFDI